jgi:hypothetical protein
MSTAFNPAKTSLTSWDAFADVDAFVDAVLAELMAGTWPTRSGPKPPLTGAALRKWRSGASRSAACSIGQRCDIPFGTLYPLFAPGLVCGAACSTA